MSYEDGEYWFEEFLDEERPWLSASGLPRRSSPVAAWETRTEKTAETHADEGSFQTRLSELPPVDWVGLPGLDYVVPGTLAVEPPDEESVARARLRHLTSLRRNGLVLCLGIALIVQDMVRGGNLAFLILIGLFLLVVRPLAEALIGLQETKPAIPEPERRRRRAEWVLFLAWLRNRPAGRLRAALWVLVGIYAIQMLKSGAWPNVLAMLLGSPLVEPASLLESRVAGGEWWRLLTCGFLHGHLIHIWFNATALYDLGRILVGILRPGVLAFVFLVSLLSGSFASLLLPPTEAGYIERFGQFQGAVGASGGILGVLGFLGALTWRRRTRLPQPLRLRVLFSIGLIALLGILGAGFIDNAAHAGGFLAGVVLALVLPASARIWNAEHSQWFRWIGLGSALVLGAGAVKAVIELLSS